MKKSHQSTELSGETASKRQPLRVARRGQYVEASDLQRLLKLGLSLHMKGEPIKRLTKTLDSLARMTNAPAWVASVIRIKPKIPPAFSAILLGGSDARLAEMAAATLRSEFAQRDSTISQFVRSPRRVPGRILAEIESGDRGIFSILPPEGSRREQTFLTWISIHRSTEAAAFGERERRLLELFHSQSAFSLLRCASE